MSQPLQLVAKVTDVLIRSPLSLQVSDTHIYIYSETGWSDITKLASLVLLVLPYHPYIPCILRTILYIYHTNIDLPTYLSMTLYENI